MIKRLLTVLLLGLELTVTSLCQAHDTGDSKTVEIMTSGYGQLAKLLDDDDALTTDTLVISGPIDSSDFKAIWRYAFSGNIDLLDLGNAKIKNNTVPEYALYDSSQFGKGHWLRIKEIILPDDVVKIGGGAFALMRLERINIPSSLNYLGESAFMYDPLA